MIGTAGFVTGTALSVTQRPMVTAMSTDLAELSSLSATLSDVLHRVTEMAERYHSVERDDVANDLFEVERSLRTAQRRMARATKALP